MATIINTGRACDITLQQQLHELVWWLSKYECKIKAVHLFGWLNKIPDLLSRWGEGSQSPTRIL